MNDLLARDELHRQRHKVLYQELDELVADFITHTGKRPSNATILELIQWSNEQTINPSKKEGDY